MRSKPVIGGYQPELLSLLLALLLVLAIVVTCFREWSAYDQRTQDLAGTRRILSSTNSLLVDVVDAETGERGFLLTGQARYLAPYNHSLERIGSHLNAVLQATRPYPNLAKRAQVIASLVAQKLALIKQTIQLRETGALDATRALEFSDRGKAVMDDIRVHCAAIQADMYASLARESKESRLSANRVALVSVGGSIALFALLILASIAIRNGIRRRDQLIFDLHQSELRANEARDWLQTTISSIGDGVIATDPHGIVTFLNPIAETLTGWTAESAVGAPLQNIFNISHEDTNEPVENPATQVLRDDRIAGLASPTCLTSKDGRRIPIDDSAAPIRDAAGKVVGVVLVFRDVSQKREAERQQAEHSRLLAQANSDLQQYAYAASHDLREPLRTIAIYTQLVQRRSGAQLDPQSQECLSAIVASTQRMARLIDALLEYSKAGETNDEPTTPVETEEILAAALANLKAATDERKAVITHDPLPAVIVDELLFIQLLQNLIGNAVKYGPEEGSPHIHISATNSGGKWIFSISDNGRGIAPQYHTSIFEPFKRLHNHHSPGAGIGLATCKKIVERYGGRIWVSSEEGKGSTFYFTIPFAHGDLNNARRSRSAAG